MSDTVSAVVVSFSDPAATQRAVESLVGQSEPPMEVLVLDNHPDALTKAAMAGWSDRRVRLVHSGHNLGYASACNRAAGEARGDWLLFLNPDARADPDCLSALLRAPDARTGVVGAQVLLPDGRVNAGDNPLHVTGIAWAGHFGEPREDGLPRRVAAVSGAALLARRRAFLELGGLCERFFMYYDDADLCWRTRLAGWDVVFCPAAVVWHEYEFEKGEKKWYWLERNRLWSVLSNFSGLSLLLLSPLIAGTELAIATVAIRGGWAQSLAKAWASIVCGLPELLRWRRQVQASRRTPDSELIELMAGHFETPLLQSGAALWMNRPIGRYRRTVLRVLRALER